VPTVDQIYVYPIKSLRGVALEGAALERRGLLHDRRWMLVDEAGEFLTQRRIAKMALFDVGILSHGLRVEVAGMPPIEVPFEPAGPAQSVRVWSSRVRAERVSPEADAWFSEAMGSPCRLVKMAPGARRRVPSREARPGDVVSFADANPVLVAGQASLDDLNSRLARPIPMLRFRPNLVVAGAAPYEEDDWPEIEVGPTRLRRTHRCGRCIVTTIDIDTAEAGDEPLRTLATYRRFGKSVCFGTYFVPEILGEIALGDEVNLSASRAGA
jgi:uncharacterized protein